VTLREDPEALGRGPLSKCPAVTEPHVILFGHLAAHDILFDKVRETLEIVQIEIM
jgi:hypothetical protein